MTPNYYNKYLRTSSTSSTLASQQDTHYHASILENNDSLVSQQNTQPTLNIPASQNNITKTLSSGTSASQQNTSHYILTLEGRVYGLWALDFTKIIDDNKSNVPVRSITRNMPMEPINYSHEDQEKKLNGEKRKLAFGKNGIVLLLSRLSICDN
ncbi:13059_t:CDS:2, partial [Funneliformis caledonium]